MADRGEEVGLGRVGVPGTVEGVYTHLATAEDLDTAQTLLDGGERTKARAALAAFLDGDREPDAVELLQAAQLARALPDIELLRTIRAAAEGLEADAEDADPLAQSLLAPRNGRPSDHRF